MYFEIFVCVRPIIYNVMMNLELYLICICIIFYFRFGLNYVDDKGEKQTPIIIHRAILGSVERLIAILTESFAGKQNYQFLRKFVAESYLLDIIRLNYTGDNITKPAKYVPSLVSKL